MASANKTYYYLKLEQDYFNNKVIKALRKMPAGAELCVCYLKMQLRYLHDEGYIQFNGICESFAEEIALDIDEDSKTVALTLEALKRWHCIEELSFDKLYLNECQKRIGSRTDVAERVARHRANNKKITSENVDNTSNLLQCNNSVTKCNDILEIEKEKDIELDKEKEIDKDIKESEVMTITLDQYNNLGKSKKTLEPIYQDIMDFYNSACNRNLTLKNKNTVALIKARLKDGFTLDDFKSVITFKNQEWSKDSNMSKYLVPTTLFGNKFVNYLEQASQPQPKRKTGLDLVREMMANES